MCLCSTLPGEPNTLLNEIVIPLNPEVDEAEFRAMIGRADLTEEEKSGMLREAREEANGNGEMGGGEVGAGGISLSTVQSSTFRSYWDGEGGVYAGLYDKMLRFDVTDLRRLMHPDASLVQGVHSSEATHQR